jgi:hypothetical protein
MALQNDARSHNQPSHESQVKGDQHSHQGPNQTTQHGANENTIGQHDQGSGNQRSQDTRSHNQPSHDAQVKGGQQSHSGNQR